MPTSDCARRGAIPKKEDRKEPKTETQKVEVPIETTTDEDNMLPNEPVFSFSCECETSFGSKKCTKDVSVHKNMTPEEWDTYLISELEKKGSLSIEEVVEDLGRCYCVVKRHFKKLVLRGIAEWVTNSPVSKRNTLQQVA